MWKSTVVSLIGRFYNDETFLYFLSAPTQFAEVYGLLFCINFKQILKKRILVHEWNFFDDVQWEPLVFSQKALYGFFRNLFMCLMFEVLTSKLWVALCDARISFSLCLVKMIAKELALPKHAWWNATPAFVFIFYAISKHAFEWLSIFYEKEKWLYVMKPKLWICSRKWPIM